MSLQELIVLLQTATTVEEIDNRRKDIADLIPQVRIMFGYDQKNYAHQYDLWFHCLHTVINLPRGIPQSDAFTDSRCKGSCDDTTCGRADSYL